jgi:demethylmenaquinone methyltransferase/2-methoxy-6-polyprenyl-1,4-benzoquinol methylase
MRAALDQSKVTSIYDKKSKWYDLQHGLVTLKSDERGRRMVVDQGVREGDRVLDAGGGTGSTALRAAARVGKSGHVVVLDLSEGMLGEAAEKAREAGLVDRMEFVTGDILKLPFEDASFDAVLSTYAVCPLYDPEAGVLELYRVVRPGGRLAVAHSTHPPNALVRKIADSVESVVWRFPSLSMGCRPVTTLPALERAGAKVLAHETFGVPLWPFVFYVVEKPALAA